MIYTVTFNPSIDYVVHTAEIKTGEVNRSNSEEIYIGGKGINVSFVLSELGFKSKALGFVAGFTGDVIEKELQRKNIESDFIHLEQGFSRINVKIKSEEETELNGQGPDIDGEAMNKLLGKIDKIKNGNVLILAGSIPKTLPSDVYEQILKRISNKDIFTVVDATGDLLLNVLKYKPFLIKPNHIELGEMFGLKLESIEEIEKYARKLQEMGAVNVLVSMAEKGALLIDSNGECHIQKACSGNVVNSVGAGDSMLAGFIAGIIQDNCEYALKLGTAAGGATAFSKGLATKEFIDKLMKQF